jgi:hypothetical protein
MANWGEICNIDRIDFISNPGPYVQAAIRRYETDRRNRRNLDQITMRAAEVVDTGGLWQNRQTEMVIEQWLASIADVLDKPAT